MGNSTIHEKCKEEHKKKSVYHKCRILTIFEKKKKKESQIESYVREKDRKSFGGEKK